jgi:hypothetical protein
VLGGHIALVSSPCLSTCGGWFVGMGGVAGHAQMTVENPDFLKI